MNVYSVTREVTAAELIAMNATPKEILPAPGAGKTIVLLGAVLSYTGGDVFTGGGTITLNMGAVAQTGTVAAATLTTNGASSSINRMVPVGAISVANTALTLTNGTAAFAAGTGTAKVTVYFDILAEL